jgi:hypothetical protein
MWRDTVHQSILHFSMANPMDVFFGPFLAILAKKKRKWLSHWECSKSISEAKQFIKLHEATGVQNSFSIHH